MAKRARPPWAATAASGERAADSSTARHVELMGRLEPVVRRDDVVDRLVLEQAPACMRRRPAQPSSRGAVLEIVDPTDPILLRNIGEQPCTVAVVLVKFQLSVLRHPDDDHRAQKVVVVAAIQSLHMTE